MSEASFGHRIESGPELGQPGPEVFPAGSCLINDINNMPRFDLDISQISDRLDQDHRTTVDQGLVLATCESCGDHCVLCSGPSGMGAEIYESANSCRTGRVLDLSLTAKFYAPEEN
jgi:hypothetical protein